jgi:succinate-semialdehyde dehydrogenase/glutarate-semialdehyde dehydrogenase
VSADLAALTGIDVPTGLFIDGEWTGNGRTLGVTDPATEDTLVEIADGTPDDALAAVAAAHRALPGWAATPPRQRAECLRKAWALMIERSDAIARLMVLENGKALRDAKGEVTYAAEFFRWYAEEAVRIDGEVHTAPAGTNRIMVLRQPVGVSVLVTPWNFPAAMATRKIGPALAAGCTVVLKPAKETPLCAFAVAEILREAGVPHGVVNVVCTAKAGPLVGAMLADPRVRKLSFTGSTEVGRTLLATAAQTVTNCSMELGGNAPFLIFEDADLDAAIDGAFLAKMRNGGEACTAANRFHVANAVREEFTEKLVKRMSEFTLGKGIDESSTLGPLINAKQVATVEDLVSDAVSRGATVAVGGVAPGGPGNFYPATVLADVPADARILKEEVFGPVAPITGFDSEEEGIAAANDTEYGLAAYIYTQSLDRALRVAESIDAGMVGVNRGVISDPAAPFGGVKQSGFGREGGTEGIEEYLETKYIALTN